MLPVGSGGRIFEAVMQARGPARTNRPKLLSVVILGAPDLLAISPKLVDATKLGRNRFTDDDFGLYDDFRFHGVGDQTVFLRGLQRAPRPGFDDLLFTVPQATRITG